MAAPPRRGKGDGSGGDGQRMRRRGKRGPTAVDPDNMEHGGEAGGGRRRKGGPRKTKMLKGQGTAADPYVE